MVQIESRVILFTLMKSSAKAKSFHVAVRGYSPQHVTLPSRNTYTSGWQPALNKKGIIGIISGTMNHRTVNHQRTT